MLLAGFTALVLALLELRCRTNRLDLVILLLGLVPVGGLLVHLLCRVYRELTRPPGQTEDGIETNPLPASD
jgi:hypothetical protein